MTDGAPRASQGPLVGTLLGRYALLRLLGEGGMGAVYEARHRDLGRHVALKTLHARYASSDDARRRFLREGQAAARIHHPHVADVFDVAIEGDVPYLVMELLEGEDLGRLLAREGALSVARTADLLVPVVAALAAAHDRDIVHRDLKPENIFLAQRRGSVTPKVLDFGISKLPDSEASAMTGTGAVLGTPHYMSPEQAQGDRELDARSDQYSLGVVLYQCATGRRPLAGAPLYALMQKTVNGDIPPPRQVLPSLPSAFEELILRAMARHPERRFANTRALGQALLGFASDERRREFAAELEVPGVTAPSAAALSAAAPATPALDLQQLELSSTLGESAHARGVPLTRAARRPLAALLAGAALLAVLAWRLAATRSQAEPAALPAPLSAAEPGASSEHSRAAALRPVVAPAAPEPVAAPLDAPALDRAAATDVAPQRSAAPRPARREPRPAREPSAAQLEAPAPAPAAAARPLPADDPEDGFVDIEPAAPSGAASADPDRP